MPSAEPSPLAATNLAYSPTIGILRVDSVQIERKRCRTEHNIPKTVAQQPQPRDYQEADNPKTKEKANSSGTVMRRIEGCPCRVMLIKMTKKVTGQSRELYHIGASIRNV